MQSLFKLAVAGFLLAWLLLTIGFYSYNKETLDPSLFREVVSSFRQQGETKVDEYHEVVQELLKEKLAGLFNELDKNKDGVITRDEFKGTGLSVLATANAIEIPKLKFDFELPEVKLEHYVGQVTPWSLYSGLLTLQFLFLILLYIADNARGMFEGKSELFHLKDFVHQVPPHVGKKVALTYDTPSTMYEKAKMVFFTLSGLVVLRAFLMLLFFAIAVSFLILSGAGGRDRHRNPRWFGWCKTCVLFFGHLMLAAMGFYRASVIGGPASPSECKIVIGNHLCMVELVYVYLATEFPSFVSRLENLAIPGFAGICRVSDALLVDRTAPDSRQRIKEAIRQRALDPLRRSQLMVFPEGTCGNQRALFQFKKGAFEPGAPVQMVATRFPYKHFNVCWTGRPSGGCDFLDLFYRMLCQFVNHVEICFLPVYFPTDEERSNSALYAIHCQQMLANVLGIPTSDATFEDYAEQAKTYRRRERISEIIEKATPQMGPMKGSSASSLDESEKLPPASPKEED